jgi:uncharacterized membrane protein
MFGRVATAPKTQQSDMAEFSAPSWSAPFVARIRLIYSALAGLAVALVLRFLAGFHPTTSVICGWDTVCVGYISSTLINMIGRDADFIRRRAALDDQGRATILTVVLVAAIAAVVAVALELSEAKDTHGLERALHVTLAFCTVAASWFMVHLIFALHYAHGYYDLDDASCADSRGLRFPGEEEPDYWDFMHFALIIGVASQTADIAISAKRLRRLNTVHALFSFAFNTVIVALTINLLAGLFG